MKPPQQEAKMALQPIGNAMPLPHVFATLLAVAYFAAAIIGFQSGLVSETGTKLLAMVGIIGAIVLSLTQRQRKR